MEENESDVVGIADTNSIQKDDTGTLATRKPLLTENLKRKLNAEGNLLADYLSSRSSAANEVGLKKQKFAPTIPPPRAKNVIQTDLNYLERNKPFVNNRKGYGNKNRVAHENPYGEHHARQSASISSSSVKRNANDQSMNPDVPNGAMLTNSKTGKSHHAHDFQPTGAANHASCFQNKNNFTQNTPSASVKFDSNQSRGRKHESNWSGHRNNNWRGRRGNHSARGHHSRQMTSDPSHHADQSGQRQTFSEPPRRPEGMRPTFSQPPRMQGGGYSRPIFTPPAKPEYVQTDGSLFGEGILSEKTVRKSRVPADKPVDCDDPMLCALIALDSYDVNCSADNDTTSTVQSHSNAPGCSVERSEANPESNMEEQGNNQLVLMKDIEEQGDDDTVVVNAELAKNLKYHQREGVKFMWNSCFKSNTPNGCVLAHCMGLGKSLQVVTLCHTILLNASCRVTRVMVLCPLSTVLNWKNEFTKWLPGKLALDVYELASAKNYEAKEKTLSKWLLTGGVLLLGYEMFRSLTMEKKKQTADSKLANIVRTSLIDPGPDVVFCDEGHYLKNEESKLFQAVNQISSRRRIILTGTPIQNSLMEYYTMVQFARPGQLGTKKQFINRFVGPMNRGQSADSSPSEVLIMKRRALILHRLLENTIQRFDSSVLKPLLPPKLECVISVKMSELQIKLYLHYLEHFTKAGSGQTTDKKYESATMFRDFQVLSRIWTHPKAFLLAWRRRESKRNATTQGKNRKKKINSLDEEEDALDFGESEAEEEPSLDLESASPSPKEVRDTWWFPLITEEAMKEINHSGKLVLLMDILRHCEATREKIIIFSQSLATLDLIEEFLTEKNSTDKVSGSWHLNTDYFRLDGATSSEQRRDWCNAFNDADNPVARLFLISTKAGGIGINLVGANRAVIFDASWNPSHDLQSVFRIYRFGQKKPCFIYRFISQGTMEEVVYYRQVAKLSLSQRIVDEEHTERFFGAGDLDDLYTFYPDGLLSSSSRSSDLSLNSRDALLAELTDQRQMWIGAYREHDSLLQNRPEEYLKSSEQEIVWKVFNKENDAQTRRLTIPPAATSS